MIKIIKYDEKLFSELVLKQGNGEYHYITGFKTSNSTVTIHHDKCNRDYTVVANEWLRGRRCWECWKKSQCKTPEWFLNKMKDKGITGYKLLSPYTRAKDKVKMQHVACGYIWWVTPDNFLRRNSRCPKCAKNARLTQKQFSDKIKKLIGKDYVFTEPYVNAHTQILCKHVTCGYTWKVAPDSIIQGTRCPKCQESHGERLVERILTELNISFVRQATFTKCVNKEVLPFDFYVESKNLCIEYDGEQHFRPVDFAGRGQEWAKDSFERGKHRDKIKDNFCKNSGIRILRIPYYESEANVRLMVCQAVA